MSSNFDITQILSSIKPGQNAYLLIQQALKEAVLPKAPLSSIIELKVLSGIFGFVSLTISISILITWKKTKFWLFRMKGNYIIVNGSTWAIPALGFYCFIQVFIWGLIASSQGELVKNLLFYSNLLWIPAFLAGWTSAWSLCSSYILQLIGNTTVTSSGRNNEPNASITHRLITSAAFINSVAIGVPILYLATMLPLGVVSSAHYRQAYNIYSLIDQQLQLGVDLVNAGGTFSIATLQMIAPLQSEFSSELNKFFEQFKNFQTVLTIFSSILFVFLTTFAFLHIRLLRKIIFTPVQVELNSKSQTHTSIGSSLQSRSSALKRAYSTLLMVFITLDLIAVMSIFCSLRTVVQADYALLNSDYQTMEDLTVLYIFAIPSLPMSILVLLRSLETSNTKSINSTSTKPGLLPTDTQASNVNLVSHQYPPVHFTPKTQINFSDASTDYERGGKGGEVGW